METGDILLCSGTSWLSNKIKMYQRMLNKVDDVKVGEVACSLSHVAMVISDGFEVFESTSLNEWSGAKGVQINNSIDWLNNYNGKVWLRRLIKPETSVFSKKLNNPAISTIQTFAEKNVGRPYENGIPGVFELLLSCIECHWISDKEQLAQKLKTKDAVFCAEIIADALKDASVINQKTRTNKIPPKDWWGDGDFDLRLINGFKYSAPQLLKG